MAGWWCNQANVSSAAQSCRCPQPLHNAPTISLRAKLMSTEVEEVM